MTTTPTTSVDALDTSRRRRATRWITDISFALVTLLCIAAYASGRPLSAIWPGLIGVGTYLVFSLLSRTRHWAKVAALYIVTSWALALLAVLKNGYLTPGVFYLTTGFLYAAATMTPRGILPLTGIGLLTLGVMVLSTSQLLEPVPRAEVILSVIVIYLSVSLGALLVASTMRTTLIEAHHREQHALEAERRALDGEARHRMFADNTDDLIILMNAEGTCVYASPSHSRVLGVDPKDIVGRQRADLVVPEDQELAGKAFLEALVNGRSTTTLRLRRADGRPCYADVRMNAIQHAEGQFVVSAARDVTTQRVLGEQLQQAQKIEALGRLAGGIAHDFNNLLTIVQICTTRAAAAPDTSARTRALLDDSLQASSRAADLTRQLLRFSRKEVVAPKRIALASVLSDAVALARRLVGAAVEVIQDIEPGLSDIVAAPTQIEQVILNLAANARDAMPKGGKLRIVAKNGDDHRVLITVTDTGEGMSEEARKHLFEPFFTTKQAGLGTGLGLATCYGIVEQLRGTIAVDSAIGVGTTFTIAIPATEDSEHTTSSSVDSQTLEHAPVRLGHVLVVEDDGPILAQMCRILKDAGHEVRSATSFEAARKEAMRGPVDVLLTDIVLGADSGLDVMRLVRGIHPNAGVLLTSGFVQDAQEVARHVAMGAEFLPKPFTEDALRSAIGRAFERMSRKEAAAS